MAALYYVVVFALMLIPTGFICKYYDWMEDREIEREARRNEQTTIPSNKN